MCFSTFELELIKTPCVFQHLSLKSLKNIVLFDDLSVVNPGSGEPAEPAWARDSAAVLSH